MPYAIRIHEYGGTDKPSSLRSPAPRHAVALAKWLL